MGLDEINLEVRNQEVLELINKLEKDIKIGLLYNIYLDSFGLKFGYKTMQRIVQELAERELITVKKIVGGAYGTTTLILKKREGVDV